MRYPWKPLPRNMAKHITCQFCQQPMRLLRVNDNIAFWVHRGKQLETCTKIAFKTAFIHDLAEFLSQRNEKLRKQIPQVNGNVATPSEP